MKKVLLSLLAVAALVLSCQNYDDEFAALNSKVASLESQISSLAGLQTALTSVQSSVSALQAAVSAIPNLSSEVAAIIDDLDALATSVAGATTSADLDALKAELNTTLAALQALIEANSADIATVVAANASLKSQLEALGVDVDAILAQNAAFEGNLTITNAAELAYAKSLGGKVATIKGDVTITVDETKTDGSGTGTGLTAAEVNAVTSLMTYVVGNVKVTTDASLDLSKLTSITGDYTVIGHDVSDDALTSVGDDVHFDHDGPYVSKIETADNIFIVAKAAAAASATAGTAARTGTTSIDFLALTKASGVQTVSSTEASAHTSGGSLTYGAPEADKSITVNKVTTSVKIGQAPVIAVISGTTAATTALTAIELHYAADLGAAASGLNPSGVAALASLTLTGAEISTAVVKAKQITGAVTIDVQASTATSNSASIDLSSTLSAGAITSDAASNNIAALKTVGGITLTEQTTFSAPELTTSTGAISLSEATTFVAPKLSRVAPAATTAAPNATTAGLGITADKVEGAVSLPALTKAGSVSMVLATSFSAPLAKISAIDIEEATTLVTTSVELGSLSTYASTPSAGTLSDEATLDVLKLHSQDATFDLTALVEATAITYNGKTPAAGVAPIDATISSANVKLASLTLGGDLGTVSVNTGAALYAARASTALASVVTSGTIRSLTVSNNYDLATLTLGHTDSTTSATASIIIISDNHNLSSVTTSVKSISKLQVTDNGKLSTLNMASITDVPTNMTWGTDTIDIDITGNYTDKSTSTYTTRYGATAITASTTSPVSDFIGMTGTYTAASAVTARSYGQAQLATLVPFFTTLDGLVNAATGAKDGSAITIDMDYKYQTAAATPAKATKTFDVDGDSNTSTAEFAEVLDLD